MANDSLDRLLAAFDVHVEAFAICEVRRGFRLTHPPSDAIEVHYVLSGEMHLTVPGTDTIVCEPGCIVIVPPHITQLMAADGYQSWLRLSEQLPRFDKWSACQG